jgi:tetratricopeptide (TPR) repeat protein
MLERAQDDFQRAVALDPTHLESFRNLDWLLAREGRWDQIIAMWTEYLARKPDDGVAWLERAGAARHKGEMTQAIADVRRACELGNERACTIVQSLPAQPRTSS